MPSMPLTAPDLFNQPSADLILRTSDGVPFRVHSPILTQASPFFADMLRLPQPTPQAPGAASDSADLDGASLPEIDVPEDSRTLELLLRTLYPVAKQGIPYPVIAMAVLKAARKYDMELPVQIMSEWLATQTSQMPARIWAAACHAGLETLAKEAAAKLRNPHGTLRYSSPAMAHDTHTLRCMEELEDKDEISAADYFRLKQYLQTEDHSARIQLKLTSSALAIEQVSSESPFEPFSTDIPCTDVLCRPGSGESPVQFHAHQIVLSVHSKHFKARLAELRDHTTEVQTIDGQHPDTKSTPCLDFDERADVVSALLNVCYHGKAALDDPRPPATLVELLAAAEKYEMVDVVHWTRAAWERAADDQPLRAYFVAIAQGSDRLAKDAAMRALGRPSQFTSVYVPEMERSSATLYHQLMRFVDSHHHFIQERMKSIDDSLIPARLHPSRGSYAESVLAVYKVAMLTGNCTATADGCKGMESAMLHRQTADQRSQQSSISMGRIWKCTADCCSTLKKRSDPLAQKYVVNSYCLLMYTVALTDIIHFGWKWSTQFEWEFTQQRPVRVQQ